ncbi:MAG TPA: ion channel [Rhodanobacteraceae bacterium]|nr:ion channel [Rhodanobacteraceae bacterium]
MSRTNDRTANPAEVLPKRVQRLRWWTLVHRHPSAILLLVQLAGLLLYPFIEQAEYARALFGASSVVVLCLAIWMVSRTPGRAWISICIALPAIALNVLYLTDGLDALLPWSASLEALFYFYAAGCLIAYMLEDRRATTDELFAAGATFTLLAWGFAYLLVLCQALDAGSFSEIGGSDLPRGWSELIFLSFALLSSTGIGNVIPLTGPARALASLEMFVGVMYIALVVSRLIGLTVVRRE